MTDNAQLPPEGEGHPFTSRKNIRRGVKPSVPRPSDLDARAADLFNAMGGQQGPGAPSQDAANPQSDAAAGAGATPDVRDGADPRTGVGTNGDGLSAGHTRHAAMPERSGEGTGVAGAPDTPAQDDLSADAFAERLANSRRPAPQDAEAMFSQASEGAFQRRSFLESHPEAHKAEHGMRGFFNKFGLNLKPGGAEAAERHDIDEVSQYWPGPRTISVVNGKGGANKTPTTVMLAAVFARYGGGQILAWDNNETRGTLGWRTAQGRHDATVMDLLPHVDSLLSPQAQSAALAAFVHHQSESKFDVLRSKPDVLASEQKIDSADFDKLYEVITKYYRLCVIDSGNDETAERWLRMIHYTNQLVIATTTREEHAEAGALLLEALTNRGGMYKDLARNAVVIVSQSDKKGGQAHAEQIAEGYASIARRAVTIPFDQALVKGRIRYRSLQEETQRAWLRAAAAVAEGL